MAVLKVSKREGIGTRVSRRLRRSGLIPGIIYGHGEPPEAVSVSRHDLEVALHRKERLLELDIDGAKQNVLVKEVQYDAMQHEMIHIDLARVSLDERVKVTVPILLRGTPAGAADGGVIHQSIPAANVECLVTAIPEDIRLSVSEMKVGDMIRVKDLHLPEGVKVLNDPESIVCTVTLVAEEVVAAPVEEVAAGEPEIIGEKKEEEPAEGAEAEAPAKKEKKEEKKE